MTDGRVRIIVANEKYCTRYLDASTDEAWLKSSLKLLTERLNEGWYGSPADYALSDEDAQILAMDEAALDALPSGVAEELRRKIRYLKSREATNRIAAEEIAEIHEVVATQDNTFLVNRQGKRLWPRAWGCLENRSDHEYEEVTLEDVEQ